MARVGERSRHSARPRLRPVSSAPAAGRRNAQGWSLRDDACYAPSSEGICILANGAEVVLTGPSIFQWVDRLAPYLDGTHTLAELTASMPAGRRDMTERVITALRERGVVVEATEDEHRGHPLTSGERLRYRREIDFLGYFGPSAARSFHAYRESAIVLAGAGRMLVETAEAVLCSGSRRLRIAMAGDQASLLATVARLRESEPLNAEEFSQRAAACLDGRLGVLGEVTERDFAQIPLAVSQVKVSDPVLLLGPGVPLPVVTGAGPSHAEARRAAVLRGLAAYGSLMVDPRLLHGCEGASVTGDPEEDLAALAAGRWDGFVWGYGLADGLPHELPAAEVFPALRGVRSRYAPPVGAAAGYDWDQAIRNGLLDQCRRLTLREIARSRRPFAPIAWTEVATDARGSRYRSMVKIVGGKLDVYDATGAAGVPTLAFCLDGVTIACACRFSFGEALRDGLAEVLLWHQARANREPGYAPAPVPPLPPRGRLSPTDCPAWSTDEAAAAARLAQLGWTAAVVPLDHDPAVTAGIIPHLVNVVLRRA